MLLSFICDWPEWLWWLLWLLPLLIGALLWWLGKNKYDNMVAEYEGKIKGLNGRINGLEEDLAACRSKRSELEGDLALTKGRMREMEAEMNDLKAKGGSDSASNLGSSGSGDASTNLGAIQALLQIHQKPPLQNQSMQESNLIICKSSKA